MKIGVVFDLDGTLLDTLQDLTDSVNYALARFGCPARTPREVRSYLGNGARQLIALSLPGENPPDVDAVLAVYKEYYQDHCRIRTRPYGGIPEALTRLGEKYAVAVASNKPDAATKSLCALYFPGIYALGEAAGCPRKPAPDMIFKAMAAVGAEKCVYVGDSEVDVLTAKNAGLPCVSVCWGFRDREELEQCGARYLCGDPAELPALIDRIVEERYGQ